MKRSRLIVAIGFAVACSMLGSAPAKAAPLLVESWEGALDGWQVPAPAGNNLSYVGGFSTSTGVTDGASSLAISSATSGLGYGQLAISPSTTALTAILGGADSLSFDVYAPGGSFGYYLQFDVDINNADAGFTSLDGYSYANATIGGEATITVPISASLAAVLAASPNPTAIIIQAGGGFSDGNQTMYLDNLRVNTVAVPEASSGTAGLAAVGLIGLARRRAR